MALFGYTVRVNLTRAKRQLSFRSSPIRGHGRDAKQNKLRHLHSYVTKYRKQQRMIEDMVHHAFGYVPQRGIFKQEPIFVTPLFPKSLVLMVYLHVSHVEEERRFCYFKMERDRSFVACQCNPQVEQLHADVVWMESSLRDWVERTCATRNISYGKYLFFCVLERNVSCHDALGSLIYYPSLRDYMLKMHSKYC